MKINSICIKTTSPRKNLWIFLDEDRIFDEIAFFKGFASNKIIGVVVRTKK